MEQKPFILMLEDDDDDRHITETFFAEHNYETELVFLANTDEVLPFLEGCMQPGHRLPSLVILDKNAPARGGMPVLRDIKQHPLLKVMPVVMLSGSAVQHEIDEAYGLGVNSFILKPFSGEQTATTIRNFLAYWFDTVALPSASSAKPELV